MIAPPLTVLLAARYGWRGAFLFTGVIGFAWCLLWFFCVPGRGATAAPPKRTAYRKLFRDRRLPWILAARFVFDPVFYFYMFWIPQYLSKERGLPLTAIGNLFWIPFLTLGVSQIFCGKLTDTFARRSSSPVKVKQIMLLPPLQSRLSRGSREQRMMCTGPSPA